MNISDLSNLPKLPRGAITPPITNLSEAEKLIKEYELKKQHKHDYMVALFSIIGGVIMGLITSIIFWLITK